MLHVHQSPAETIRIGLVLRKEDFGKKKKKENSAAYKVPKDESTEGRPRYHVGHEQIERLMALGFSQKRIAELLGISRITLWRRMQEVQVDGRYDDITANQLDELVENYRKLHPYAGEREMLGHVRSKQPNVQRHRVRESIHRVDPINTALRWHDKLHRKPYSVPSPNTLWHIDANLKLLRRGFVIQAAVDGFSRISVYAKCSLDNKAQTTLTSFTAAEWVYGTPSRVRYDFRRENIQVGQHNRLANLLRTRSLNRGSIITIKQS